MKNEYSGIYRWDLKTDEWTQFSDCEENKFEPTAAKENYFFYEEDGREDILVYDVEKKEKQIFLNNEQISLACETYIKERQGDFQCFYLYKLFCQGDRLYVEGQVDWEKNDAFRMNFVIFYVDLTRDTQLRLERG